MTAASDDIFFLCSFVKHCCSVLQSVLQTALPSHVQIICIASQPAALVPADVPLLLLVGPDALDPAGVALLVGPAAAEFPVAVEGPVAALVGVSEDALEVGPAALPTCHDSVLK